jgi:hypothetical protein
MVDEVSHENVNIALFAIFTVVILPTLFALAIVGITNICDYIGDVHRILPTVIMTIFMFFIYKKLLKTE